MTAARVGDREARRAAMREHLRHSANQSRELADEIAARWHCDDPLHPWALDTPWTEWRDFTNQVCRRLVEADGDDAEVQAAMRAFRRVSPYYLAAALVMAENRIRQIEQECANA